MQIKHINKIFHLQYNWYYNYQKQKYILSQFPYPSGDLHLGHARVYLIGDALTQYYKLRNYQVLYPMGWDSFGLPAQNAAILNKQNPRKWTINNISRMKKQLQKLKIQFPWDRQISTCQPQYYKWTQLIFIKMFQMGLAYKSIAYVNWDPVDKTVLANQQVDQNGYSWRSGAKVQKKQLQQWFFKIRQYAGQLVQGLQGLDKWINQVKQMQKGWISLKNGYYIPAKIIEHQNQQLIGSHIQIFTQSLSMKQIDKYVYFNEGGQQKIIGKICLLENNIQIILMRGWQDTKQQGLYSLKLKKNQDQNILLKNYRKGQTMRLKDWLISRQRYWGTPIPIIYCQKCGILTVPEQQLPVKLPQWPQGTTQNPLTLQSFKKCQCPKCKGEAQRQSDTMDTFVDSSWYFLRFLDPKNQKLIANPNLINSFMPVKIYIGGMEHAIMHLLYARFVMRALYHCKLADLAEPFEELVVQGLIKGKTYKHAQTQAYIPISQVSKYPPTKVIQTYEKMSKSKYNGVTPDQVLEKYSIDQLRISLLFAGPPQNDIQFHNQMLISARRYLNRIDDLFNTIKDNIPVNTKINKQKIIKENKQLIKQIQQLLIRLQLSIQKRYIHVYIANVMQFTNLTKSVIQNNQLKKQVKLFIFYILMIILKPIAPQKNKNIIQNLIKIYKQQQINFNQWPIIKSNIIQIIIKKGNKIIQKKYINKQLDNQQIIRQLSLNKQNIISIKKLQKNMIIVLK